MSYFSSPMASCVRGVGRRLPAFLLFLAAYGTAACLQAHDCTQEIREAAKTWGMQRIAVIEAAQGDIQGAKHTLTQIDENGPKRPAEVTVVWFCNRMPIYERHANFAGWGAIDDRGTQTFSIANRTPDYVPPQVPPGLPANYLAADPRHGPVVDFTSDYDAQGRCLTSRRYADGAFVIETLRQ